MEQCAAEQVEQRTLTWSVLVRSVLFGGVAGRYTLSESHQCVRRQTAGINRMSQFGDERESHMLTWFEFFDSPADARLIRYCGQTIELTVNCETGGFRAKQLVVLRKHIACLRERPISEVQAVITQSATLTTGQLDVEQATRVRQEFEDVGLEVVSTVLESESYSAFDVKMNMMILMVDCATTDAMIAQMISDGVPVINQNGSSK